MRRKMGYHCLCLLLILGIMGCSQTNNSINATDGDRNLSPTLLPTATPRVKVSKSDMYQQAIDLIKAKHYPQAIGILKDLGDYQSSGSLLKQLRYIISGCYISNGQWAVGAITSSGGVAIACESEYA